MNRIFRIAAIAVALGLGACGGGGGSQPAPQPTPTPTPTPPPETPLAQLKRQTTQWQDAQLQALQGLSCPDARCEAVTVRFSDGQFQPAKLKSDQTILVIDTGGLDWPSAVTYRTRVKSQWEWDASGQIRQRNASVSMPRYLAGMYASLSQLRQQAPDAFIPAAWLEPLRARVQQISPQVAQPYAGHGAVVLGYVAEHNPQAELVVADVPDFASLFKTEFCAGNAEAFRQKVATASAQFRQRVLEEQQVEYVNMSAGWELSRSIATSAERLCGGGLNRSQQQALLRAHDPFMQQLFASERVLGVQAGSGDYQPDEHELDALPLPNRVRVGFYNSGATPSTLDAQGVPRGALPPVPDFQRNSLAILDVLVNFNFAGFGHQCQPGPYTYAHPGLLGLGYGALCSEQTSWAAPTVLSRLVHLRESRYAGQAWSAGLIGELKQALTPRSCQHELAGAQGQCTLQDPLQHRQHELFRLGYLP
ncbi:hypothetical protein [Chitinilyticum litopenaei]|uniref:hypothetical protein n=1 Tax=Chitinilyticum litopenaei TaxID=1121276 RepID=UPI000426D711|nr:hypothetical protein [Chitinilyticum litopenaei]